MMRRLPVEILCLTLILLLAAYLRYTNVGENPHWYTDEATHINIAQNLSEGRIQYMVIQDSTLLFARPPLFHIVLAGLLHPDHDEMLTLRRLTATLATLTVLLLYAAVRRHGDWMLALLAALSLAIYPQAVLYNRMGYSYNLTAPLMMVALLGLSSFAQNQSWRWLALGAVAIGLGTVVDITMFNLILPMVIVVIIARRPLHLMWSVPLAFVPFGLYALVMLLHAPDAFLFDLRFTLSRLNPHPEIDWQINNLAHNYNVLLNQDLWFPAGVIGLFLVRPAALRWAGWLMFMWPLFNTGRIVALYNLSAYYMIPLLPFVALGVAALVRYGAAQMWQTVGEIGFQAKAVRAAVVAFTLVFLVGIPLWTSTTQTLHFVQDVYVTDIDPFLTNPWAAREVARYINSNGHQSESVVVSPVLSWMLDLNVVDYQMTAAALGNTTPHLPPDIAPERFAFDPSHHAARYVVVDPSWESWGVVHVPGLQEILREVETWTLVFESGGLRVYENPSTRAAR
jgi:4-amino-4-deoxy-L-arabinose transferase-like glycosyltransferase